MNRNSTPDPLFFVSLPSLPARTHVPFLPPSEPPIKFHLRLNARLLFCVSGTKPLSKANRLTHTVEPVVIEEPSSKSDI